MIALRPHGRSLVRVLAGFLAGCGKSCPVEYLSWGTAAACCNKLSDTKGLSRCYTWTGAAPLLGERSRPGAARGRR